MRRRTTTLADGAGEACGALACEITNGVAAITIGSGRRRNVLAPSEWDELTRIAQHVATQADVKVVVVRGREFNFSAGSDLRFWRDADSDTVDDDFARIEAALQSIERMPVPTIAVVEGVAAGAGCELALACDLRLFADTALIGLPILQLGVLVSPHFVLRLTSLIGISRARELLYSGRLVSAAEADNLGMVNKVVPAASMDAELATWVSDISRQPRSGLVAAKAASTVALSDLRVQHDAPGWAFSDPAQLPDRINAFFSR
jgi:enoyl-CoA hydratase